MTCACLLLSQAMKEHTSHMLTRPDIKTCRKACTNLSACLLITIKPHSSISYNDVYAGNE